MEKRSPTSLLPAPMNNITLLAYLFEKSLGQFNRWMDWICLSGRLSRRDQSNHRVSIVSTVANITLRIFFVFPILVSSFVNYLVNFEIDVAIDEFAYEIDVDDPSKLVLWPLYTCRYKLGFDCNDSFHGWLVEDSYRIMPVDFLKNERLKREIHRVLVKDRKQNALTALTDLVETIETSNQVPYQSFGFDRLKAFISKPSARYKVQDESMDGPHDGPTSPKEDEGLSKKEASTTNRSMGIVSKAIFHEFLNSGTLATAMKQKSDAISRFQQSHFLLTVFRPLLCLVLIFWDYFQCFYSDTIVLRDRRLSEDEDANQEARDKGHSSESLDEPLKLAKSAKYAAQSIESAANVAKGMFGKILPTETNKNRLTIAEPGRMAAMEVVRNDQASDVRLYDDREIESLLRLLNMRNAIDDKIETMKSQIQRLQSEVESLSSQIQASVLPPH